MSTDVSGTDVVYTALFGDYEEINEQPVARSSSARFVCFTDNRELRSDTWDVRHVDPFLIGDPSRSSRFVKTLGYRELGALRSLYIDNSVKLTCDPVDILDAWLQDRPIAMMAHQYRRNIDEEFKACLRAGVDSSVRLKEQREHYRRHLPAAFGVPLLWGGMIARTDDASNQELMEAWFAHILRFSRRDQVSLPAAIAQTGVSVRMVPGLNVLSEWHRWPDSCDRDDSSRVVTLRGRTRLTVSRSLRKVLRRS